MAADKTVAPRTWDAYTYAYPDPDNAVFHVGKGVDKRIFAHEQEAESGCSCRKCRIRETWATGKPAKKHIVYETLIDSNFAVFRNIRVRRPIVRQLCAQMRFYHISGVEIINTQDDAVVR